MKSISFSQIWSLFYKEITIITGSGLALILTLSIIAFTYLFGFLLTLPELQRADGIVDSVSTHTYSSSSRRNQVNFDAIISFIDREENLHTFKSFSVGKYAPGTEFTILYRMDDFEGMKAYTISDLFLLGIFYFFLFIAPLPIYLMMIEYFRKKVNRLIDTQYNSIYRNGMIFWFVGVFFCLFGGGLTWMYYEGNIIIFTLGIIVMFFVGKNLLISIEK